jgi:hypothetical protein
VTTHAQFDAHTGLFPCCGAHLLESFGTSDAMDTDPELVTCGKAEG